MTWILIRKLLRDIALALVIVALLLFLFMMLWAKIAQRIAGELLPMLQAQQLTMPFIRNLVFQGPGKIVQALMGGEGIQIERAQDMLSISLVHPLTQTILCIWAVGRASAALAGEIDRGTMELLLAQPIRRSQVVFAHLCVDGLCIPCLCLVIWAGLGIGTWLVGLQHSAQEELRADPLAFGPALLNTACLVWAVSGYSMCLSAAGRFRGRVLGLAILLTLVQFLVNVVGQLWDRASWLRPVTVFYYYQPQPMVLQTSWPMEVYFRLGVLLLVGVVGYLGALWIFTRRDLPAPL